MPGLKTAEERVGTAYFEFEAIKDGADPQIVFIHIDDFDSIEALVREHIRDFDYVGPNSPPNEEWRSLMSALESVAHNVTACELADWLRRRIAEERTIYLNGV